MITRLEREETHRDEPFEGYDEFHFDIPAGEKYREAQLEILEEQQNAGAEIETQPPIGDTGPGKTIRVRWWFEGSNDRHITYRIRAFTIKRAILVAIENTGKIPLPFEIGLSEQDWDRLEQFVDTITEVAEDINARRLFRDYYSELKILKDNECTKNNIRDKLIQLGNKDYIVDLAILGHGGKHSSGSRVLILHDGMANWDTNSNNLTEPEVRAWKSQPEFDGLKFGLVYMMNCYSEGLNETWLDLGFKTAIGFDGVNAMPELMFTDFWELYRRGKTPQEAALKSWEKSNFEWFVTYSLLFLGLSIVEDSLFSRLSSINFGSLGNLLFDGSEALRKAKKLVEESKPVVSGDPNFKITDNI